MDLVRDILREAADSAGPLDARTLTGDAHPFGEVAYHVEIMRDAGLVEASVTRAMGGERIRATVTGLTWAGNDFLDAVASDAVWSQVKRCVAKTVGSASFEVVKALAVKVATDALM